MKARIIYSLLLISGIAAGISLIRSTVGQGTDFQVFWRAARHLINHEAIYDVGRDGVMCFKYPPWIVPFFAPFAALSFESAKWIWGGVQVSCIGLIAYRMRKSFEVSTLSIALAFALFWGIWAVHALDGQVILPILTVALFSGASATAVALSTKVFTVFPLFLESKGFFEKTTLFRCSVLVLTLILWTAWSSYDLDFQEVFKKWAEAATSGSEQFSIDELRRGKSQSLASWFARILSLPPESHRSEIPISILGYSFLFWLLRVRFSERFQALGPDLRWILALALTPVFHPLPWHHLYVFCYPLLVVALDRLFRGDLKPGAIPRILLFTSIILLTLSSERALGPVGRGLKENMGRAWGALGLSFVFLFYFKPKSSAELD